MITEEQYIEIYDKFGHKLFGHGSDQQLKEWGNTDEEIRQKKIGAVKGELDFHKTGIKIYKSLNEMCGGTNKI